MQQERIVVIGAGPAGVAAAVQCARLDTVPLLLDRTGRPGGLVQNAHSIENFLGTAPVSGSEFAVALADQLKRFGIPVRKGDVLRIEPVNDGFLLSGGMGVIRARAVIVAPGSNPLSANIPGEADLAGVRLFYEVRNLLALRPRKAAVVGSGEGAFDYALSLAASGCKVDLLARGQRSKAGNRLTTLAAENSSIKIRYRTVISQVFRCDDGVGLGFEGRKESSTREYDGIVVAVGRQSAVPPLLPPGTDIFGLTIMPGLYIAGDARLGSLGQVAIAAGDGLMCARMAVDFLE